MSHKVVLVWFVQMVPHLTLLYCLCMAICHCFLTELWGLALLVKKAKYLSRVCAIFNQPAGPIHHQAHIFLVHLLPTNIPAGTCTLFLLSLANLSFSWAFAFLIAPLHIEAVFLYSSFWESAPFCTALVLLSPFELSVAHFFPANFFLCLLLFLHKRLDLLLCFKKQL